MVSFLPNLRRRSTSVLANSVEACEVRMLLSAGAIYPLEVPVSQVESSSIAEAPSPSASSSDYSGTWMMGTGGTLILSLSGDPSAPKAKGTFTNPYFSGAKFKGKITGTELEGVIRGRATLGAQTGRSRIELSVHLTDSTHFSGTTHAIFKGNDFGVGPITGTKV